MPRKIRKRPPKTERETALAQLRGYCEPDNLTRYEHDMGSAVNRALKDFGLDRRFSEEQVFDAWNRVVSPEIASHARPVALEREVLYIQVLHSSIHFELERLKGRILQAMQSEFGKSRLRDVKFRLG